MPSKTKRFVGNNLSRSQVWSYSPPVTSTAPNWALTVNGKTLTVVSDGTPAGAVKAMQAAWSASQEPDFQEITASVPASGSVQANPQGTGTNKINSIAITGSPTGGSFGLAWAGAVATFLHDPTAAPSVTDSGTAGNPNGAYRYAYSFVAVNPLGQIGETKLSPEATITVASHGVLVTIPTGPAGTIARKIYRTLAGGAAGTEQLVWEILDNTTTEFFDNIADGSLGAAAPSGNTTGIPYNATAQQIQNVLQNLGTIGPDGLVCAGDGTADDPWVAQFVNSLGAQPQPDIVCVGWSFVWPTTVPPQTVPQVVVTEIQPGVVPFDVPPADGAHLVLTGPPGVPFYVENSVVSGTLTPEVDIKTIGNATAASNSKSNVTVTREAATIPAISITPIAPTITAVRTVQGAPAVNEIQRLTIGPNAQSGPGVASTIALTWNGQTTGAIPLPPQPCVASVNPTAGNLHSSSGYVWVVTFITQYGETEPSQPTTALKITNQQASLTSIPTGASVVTARKLYRATLDAQGNIGPYLYLATLADNTTTTYADNTANANLGVENPPTTNFALQGALEALSNTGQGTIKASVANYPAWSGHYNGQSITYDVEFEGALGGAPQPLITGDVSAVAILPRILVTEVRRGSPPANTIQQFGWKQVLGYGLPSGTFTLTIPSLNITTGPIAANASASVVLSAIQAVASQAYQKAFSITSVQSTSFGYQWQIAFGDVLAQTDVPPVVLNIAGMTAQQIPVPDTLTGDVSTVIHGSITGEDQMFAVSLEDGATGGTFTLAVSQMQEVDGGQVQVTLATTGNIAYNATASDLQTALNAALSGATSTVTGNAGGPWTIEFVGDFGAQQLLLSATSALTLTGLRTGSPPTVNTAGVDPPVVTDTSTANSGGSLSIIESGYFTYGVTAVNPNGETTTATIDVIYGFPFGSVTLNWNAVPTATSYRVYRNNTLVATVTNTGYTDYFGTNAAATPPASNTASINPPTGLTATPVAGGMLYNTEYYYKITGTTSTGETTGSGEVVVEITNGAALLKWDAMAGSTGYKIYRGDSSGQETVLVATITDPSQVTFYDNGQSQSPVSQSPPTSSTSNATVPTNLAAAFSASGVLPADQSYIYQVTAEDISNVETLPSNSVNGLTGQLSNVSYTLTWDRSEGARQYFIYRKALSGGFYLVGIIPDSATPTFIDSGEITSTASPPTQGTAVIAAPAQTAPTALVVDGAMPANTYYYVVTAITAAGETGVSNEESIAVAADGIAVVSWGAVANATGYKIYRGTSAAGENTLVATINSGAATTFYDSGPVNTSASLPSTNTALIAAPTQTAPAAHTTGGAMATGTYYYVVTAYTNAGETTVSNEESITVTGPTGSVTINWNVVTGADGYKIYRGTSAGSENLLVATIAGGNSTTFTDTDIIATFSCTELVRGAPPINEVWTIAQQYAIGGTYSIGFNGVGTAALAYNSSAAQIQTAMQGLITIGPNNCAVSTNSPSNGVTQIIVTFQGALGGLPMPDVTVTNQLVGTTAYDVLLTNALGGTFTLQVGNAITGDISATASAATVQGDLTALSTVGAGNATVASGNSLGEWIVSFNTSIAASVGRPIGNVAAVVGSITDLITYTGPATGTFSLSINNRRTSQLSGTAAASDVQAALEQILPGAIVAVTGSAGGPWAATVTAALSGLGSDIADGLAVGISLGFVVSLKNTIAGTFTLTSGEDTSLGIAYDATPAQVTTAILGMSQFGSATVTGQTGGPWTITITPQNNDTPPTLTGNRVLLVGPSGSFDGYPTIYAAAIGPNFWDAPGNWADGSPPSAYLPTPPAVVAVIPTSGGTLTLGDTFYYKVTALNANGETNGGTESSGQTVSPVTLVVNGATGGTYTLSYGGQTTSALAYNAPATGTDSVQTAMQALSSVGAGNCTVTGAGTSANPFELVFSGAALTNGRPAALTANITSLTPSPGSSVSIASDVQQSFTLMWTQVPNATGYKIYRGTAAGSENVLVATFNSPDQTVFIDDGTYTTTAASPPANANAWNTAVGDDVVFIDSDIDCLYSIGSSIVNGYSPHGSNGNDPYRGLYRLPVNSYSQDSTYTGSTGLPAENALGYEEYRPTQLSIVGPPGGIFNVAIGNGDGNGSPFSNFDFGTCQLVMVVNKTGTATGNTPAILVVNSNAASEIDLFNGSLAVNFYPGQTSELSLIRQAYQTNIASDTSLVVGAGVTLATLLQQGGDSTVHSSVGVWTIKGGSATQDAGTVGTLSIEPTSEAATATYTSKSTGAITTLNVSAGGVFDRSEQSQPIVITTINLYAGYTLNDPHGCIQFITLNLVKCGLTDAIDLGTDITLTRTQN